MPVKQLENGKWYLRINRKGIKPIRRTFDSKKEAELVEADYLFNAKQIKKEITDPRSLIQLIDIWYQAHGITLSRHKKLYDAMIAAALKMGNPIAQALTPEIFINYRFQRTQKDKKPISQKTMNNIHGYISAMFNLLKKLEMIDYDNPIANIDKLKIQEKQMSYLTLDQINILLDSISSKCDNESTWFVANICLRTGSRWGEAENIHKKQLHNNCITFVNTKSKRTRTIPLDKPFYDELVAFSCQKQPDEPIFKGCITSFRRAMARTGITLQKGQCTHVLRHSFASHFVMSGGNILTLQKILGHSDIKMTMRYAHLAPNHLADAVLLNPVTTLIDSELSVKQSNTVN